MQSAVVAKPTIVFPLRNVAAVPPQTGVRDSANPLTVPQPQNDLLTGAQSAAVTRVDKVL